MNDPGVPPDNIRVDFPTLEEIALQWPLIEHIIRRATDRSIAYEPIDILQRVMMGRMSLIRVRDIDWIVAVAVTEVRELPRERVLEVLFAAGTGLNSWIKQLLEVIDTQAEIAGCSNVMVSGRKGWQKFGFEHDGVILRRRVGR